jgi:hypothetical protein
MFDCEDEENATFTDYNQEPSKLRRKINNLSKVKPEIHVSDLDETVKNKKPDG